MARVPSIVQVGSVRPDIDRAGAARERAALRDAARAREARNRAATEAFGAAFNLIGTLRKERQEAEDRTFENKTATEARKRFPEFLFGEELEKKLPFELDGFRQPVGARLDELSEALIDEGIRNGGRASPEAVEGARTRLKKLQASFLAQAAVFENNARVEEMTRDLDRNLGDLALFAADDPSLLPELLQEADTLAVGAETLLPAEAIAARRQAARKTIAEATVKGVIERDPGLAAEMLEAGDFDENLEAGRKVALIGGAKTAMRLEKESAARELAADRRELKHDADAAIAKLRGGQPVAEVAALENRAETLADGETRAALRHAEDDRFLMRGFAQRPPAAQAALIAAMENGPELKPAETRRLAAMKAQAAVTERALAKGPLAYAQSSGVIEEPADLTDLSPEALRARLRQAETAAEQFGLATLPLLQPGEAEALAKKLTEGTPEDLRAKVEKLAELPVEVRQALFDEVAPELPLAARRDFRQAAGLDTEAEGGEDPEPALPQPRALADVPPEQIAQRELEAQQARHREINAFALNRILHTQPPAELQEDFDRLQEDFFLRTGDLRLSHRLALQEIDEIWGLAGEGPSLRIARRAEAEGEVQSLGALRSLQGGLNRDDLEKVFDAIGLLAEFGLAGTALGGGAKLGRALLGAARKGKKAKRAGRAVGGADEPAARDDLDVGSLVPPSKKQLQRIEKKLGKEAAQNAQKEMVRLTKSAEKKVPAEWAPAIPSRKAIGVRWADPRNVNNSVRIDKGRPESQFPSQRVDHVIVNHQGVVIGRDGKPISGSIQKNGINAHIPLGEYMNWSTWHSP